MFKSLILVASLAFLSTSAFAQNAEDINRLRAWLGASPAETILPSSPSQLRTGPVLKIHLATGTDQKVHREFLQWIDKWNQADGKQLGMLEIVPDLDSADLILARFNGDTAIEQRGSISTSPNLGVPSGNSRVGARTVVYRPVYAYLVARAPNAFEIVYRHVDRTTNHEDPNGNLLSELKKKIKQR